MSDDMFKVDCGSCGATFEAEFSLACEGCLICGASTIEITKSLDAPKNLITIGTFKNLLANIVYHWDYGIGIRPTKDKGCYSVGKLRITPYRVFIGKKEYALPLKVYGKFINFLTLIESE